MVSNIEICLMDMMEKGHKIDWLYCVTKGLKEYQAENFQSRGLGGGSFATWVAMKLNFNLDGGECARESLTLKNMRSRHILGRGLTWKDAVFEEEAPVDIEEEEARFVPPRTRTSYTDIPSSSTAPPPSSLDSKMDLILSQLGEASREREMILSEQRKIMKSQKKTKSMLRKIMSQLCFMSDKRPSPPSPRSPSPPLPPTVDTHAPMDVEDEEIGEETLAETRASIRANQFYIAPREDANMAMGSEAGNEEQAQDEGEEYSSDYGIHDWGA